MTTKSELAFIKSHGFDLRPTHISKSGTGLICDTIQGYQLTRSDGKPASWVGGSSNWHSSKTQAIKEIKGYYEDASEQANMEKLKSVRAQYLEWLLVIWPGSQGIRNELERRRVEAIRRAKIEDEKERERKRIERLHRAAPKMLTALRMFMQLNPTCNQGVTSCGECAVCLGSQAVAETEEKS